jgi:hypothetical protein
MDDKHKCSSMHDRQKCLRFSTLHLCFAQYSDHITLRRFRFQRAHKTFTTFKIRKQYVGLYSKRELEFVSNKNQ